MNKLLKLISFALHEQKNNTQFRIISCILFFIVLIINFSILTYILSITLKLNGVDSTIQAILKWLSLLAVSILIFFLCCTIFVFLLNVIDIQNNAQLLKILGYSNMDATLYTTISWFISSVISLFINDILTIFIAYNIMTRLGITVFKDILTIIFCTIAFGNISILLMSHLLFLVHYLIVRKI